MVALVALVLAFVVLFAWLSGHWMARVVALIGLGAPVLLYAGLMAGAGNPGPAFLTLLIGLPAAWIISGVPAYVRRRRNVYIRTY